MRADARVFKKQDDRSDVNRIVSIDVPELGCQGDYVIFPGFCDVHVHLREPGFSYKETIETGTKAAAHGGYTTICPMPNLNPVPDNYEHLKEELDLIEKEALIEVLPYGSCTVKEEGKEIASLKEMAPYVCAFSDDGKGIQEETMMEEVMVRAKELGKIVAAHCEVNELLKGGYIHDGEYARKHGHKGICSESEWKRSAGIRRFQDESAASQQRGSGSSDQRNTGRNDRYDRYRPCPAQRGRKSQRAGEECHGHRRAGDGFPVTLYQAGEDGHHIS